jgi:hypothetical protein
MACGARFVLASWQLHVHLAVIFSTSESSIYLTAEMTNSFMSGILCVKSWHVHFVIFLLFRFSLQRS